jgi:hypothetical protein
VRVLLLVRVFFSFSFSFSSPSPSSLFGMWMTKKKPLLPVSPITGKPGVEVLVQGKQGKAVTEYLVGKGIPKNWIHVSGK